MSNKKQFLFLRIYIVFKRNNAPYNLIRYIGSIVVYNINLNKKADCYLTIVLRSPKPLS